MVSRVLVYSTLRSPSSRPFDPVPHTALAISLIESLDFEQLSDLHRRVVPRLKTDILGRLPTELALCILQFVPVSTLLQAGQVSQLWHALAEDQVLWMLLCKERGWRWKGSAGWDGHSRPLGMKQREVKQHRLPDEGFSDDGDADVHSSDEHSSTTSASIPLRYRDPWAELYYSNMNTLATSSSNLRHSLPAFHPSNSDSPTRPDYKLLFRTRTVLDRRLRTGQYKLTVLNAPTIRASLPADFTFPPIARVDEGMPIAGHGHTSTVYAICLARDAVSGEPCVLTASRDQTILQWRIPSPLNSSHCSLPTRVFSGSHSGSILSICVSQEWNMLISGGSDGRVVAWDMRTGRSLRVAGGAPGMGEGIEAEQGHEDGVLCVRCDERRVVSCGKGSSWTNITSWMV